MIHPEKKAFDPVADIEDFHRKFDLFYDGRPRALPEDLQSFREDFLAEELEEYRLHVRCLRHLLDVIPVGGPDPAEVTFQLEEMLDGLVDLVYVALGTSHLHGFDFAEAWRRVHAANMAKIRAAAPEDSKRNSTHDVIKPMGWLAPDHTDLVEDHAHRSAYPGPATD